MEEEQTLQLLSVISTAYRSVELNEEEVELWVHMLHDVPFDLGQANLKQHLLTNRFPPTLADIARPAPVDASLSHRHLQAATETLFLELESWAASNKPPEEGYWEAVRARIVGEAPPDE